MFRVSAERNCKLVCNGGPRNEASGVIQCELLRRRGTGRLTPFQTVTPSLAETSLSCVTICDLGNSSRGLNRAGCRIHRQSPRKTGVRSVAGWFIFENNCRLVYLFLFVPRDSFICENWRSEDLGGRVSV